MNIIKGKLKFNFDQWWVIWGEKSQLIDKSVDTSKFVDGNDIEFTISISAIDERYRAFPL